MRLKTPAIAILALLVAPGVASSHPFDFTPSAGSAPPQNDLTPLPAIDLGKQLETAPVQRNREPALESVPRARCGPKSNPLGGVQGRVPASAIDAPEAAGGYWCNLKALGRHTIPGGFRTWRYVDESGRQCAYYDSSPGSPLNALRLAAGGSPGVVVLDMSDPEHPVQTDILTALPMRAPHESLNLNRKRGLLAAEMGSGGTYPALMSIYDVSEDCRHPVERSTVLPTRFGHESGFSHDGKTFWIGGGVGISAVDVSNPAKPRTLWSGNVYAHGLSLSRSGNRLYDADPINGNLVILDVSEVQARKPNPEVREISRLTWNTVSVPQNTARMRIDGKPYLLEFDEFGFRFSTVSPPDTVGAARIIGLSGEKRPRVVSNLRLEVNQVAEHKAANVDPSPLPGASLSYSGHYCAIPREVDPEIVACSFINSGLRIFNIENPRHPREVAYFVAPPTAPSSQGYKAANFAMSQPAFDRKRREVWYTDATSGFYSLRLSKRAWPNAGDGPRAGG